MARERGYGWQGFALSICAHGALAWSIVLLPSAPRPKAKPYVSGALEITWGLARPKEPVPTPSVRGREVSLVRSPRVATRQKVHADVVDTIRPPEAEPASSAQPRAVTETRKPSYLDLSALAAARSLVNLPLSSDAPGVAPAITASQSVGPRREALGQPAEADRDEPLLTPRSDGSYFFRGKGIRATILRNGDVSFADRAVSDPAAGAEAPIEPPPSLVPENEKGSTIFAVATVKMKIDFTGPHSAERRWFLDRTRQLRDDLVRKEAQRRLAQLNGLCERIWSAGAASFAERRRKTFELWDSLADDELGAQGRAMIEKFVRLRCPRDSGCAFSALELTSMNRARASREHFAPYRPASVPRPARP